MLFWVGGFGADMASMGGRTEGIGTLLAGAVDTAWSSSTLSFGPLATRTPSPSWLAAHPTLDVVYAAHEGAGTVAAYRRSDVLRLLPIGRPLAVGDSPCHIAVAPDGTFMVVSCYGDGRVVRVALRDDGALGGAIVVTDDVIRDPHSAEEGSDQDFFSVAGVRDLRELAAALAESAGLARDRDERDPRDRDEDSDEELDAATAASIARALDPNAVLDAATTLEPVDAAPVRASHAHATVFLPDGRIATTDLGFDAVRIWRPGPNTLRADHVVALPFGSGPRHMVMHPSGHLHVVTEYSCEVFTLAAGPDGRWAVVAGTVVSPDAVAGFDFPSELSADREGGFLYAGVRGSNAIAALRVRGSGERVEPIAMVESGGDWPRHHLVDHDTVLVANQLSGDIASLLIDERTGVPGRPRHRTDAGSPSCILPARTD